MSAVLSFSIFTYSDFHNQKTREIRGPLPGWRWARVTAVGFPGDSGVQHPRAPSIWKLGLRGAQPPTALRGSGSLVGSLGAEMKSDHLQTPPHTPLPELQREDARPATADQEGLSARALASVCRASLFGTQRIHLLMRQSPKPQQEAGGE